MQDPELITIPAMNVLGTTRTGSYTLIPGLLMEVFRYLQERDIPIAGPPVFLCHETSPAAVAKANAEGTARVEVAWPVTGKVRGSGNIRSYTLPAGRMARMIHRGPYETCEPTYLALFAWLEENGLAITGPIRESYPNDPRIVPPGDLITEILVPVQSVPPATG